MIRAERCARCGMPTHAGRFCQDCYARLRADVHDDERCECKWCLHARYLRESERDREDARTHGGLRPDAFLMLRGSNP